MIATDRRGSFSGNRKWIFALTCILVSACSALAQQPAVSGYVYSKSGTWRVVPPDSTDLDVAMPVHAGDSIQLRVPKYPARIDIGLLNGTLLSRECTSARDCSGVAVPSLAPDNSFWSWWKNAAAGLISRPPPVVFAMARSAKGPQPSEAVLAIRNNRLEVAPAMKGIAVGRYTVILTSISGTSHRVVTLSCAWNPASPCTAGRLEPGLYSLKIAAASQIAGSGVPVLIPDDAAFSRVAKLFEQAEQASGSWKEQSGSPARHYFLASVLLQLSMESAQPK